MMNTLRKNLFNIKLILKTFTFQKQNEKDIQSQCLSSSFHFALFLLLEYFSLFTPLRVSAPRQNQTVPPLPNNYPTDGTSVYTVDLPTGYHYKVLKGKIGAGNTFYQRVSRQLYDCELPTTIPWLITYRSTTPNTPNLNSTPIPKNNEIGNTMIVHAKFFLLPIWTQNPIKILEKSKLSNATELSVGGLEGHLLKGEDTFIISYDENTEDVYFQISTCSQVNSWLGYLILPFIRKLQIQFLLDNLNAWKSM